MKLIILAFLAIVALTRPEKVTYDGYKVYSVIATTTEQVDALKELKERLDYDFWTDRVAVNTDVRIMVSPPKIDEFLSYLEKYEISSEVKMDNVQRIIDAQLIPANHPNREDRFRNTGSFNWDRYQNLDEINSWLDELPNLYPGIVQTVVMGSSNEGREIKGVVINYKPENTSTDRLIGMLEGGIHSREWISPATLTWVINEFLTSTDPDTRSMAENIEWHIFPVVNPDGYVYTFDTNRLWRKNRNYNHNTACGDFGVADDISNGIDLNRNFDFVWMSIGASQNPCTETYAGWAGFSEPESRAIANYVLALKERGNLMYYISFHSYSQLLLVPYSHVAGASALEVSNYGDLYEIGVRAMDKLKERYGTVYEVGTSAEILYPISGGSFDWVKAVANVPIAYLYELRDTAEYGFLLPTAQIIPNNEEVMDSLVEMHRVAMQLGYYSGAPAVSASVFTLLAAVLALWMTA